VDWTSIFDEARPACGASEAAIERFVATIGQPLSAAEIAEINRDQENPFRSTDPLHAAYRPFDPSGWVLPSRPLPQDYLSFLRWSNGGWCSTGDREFGFFPTEDPTNCVRDMMLAYHLPQYMPGALPFAFNGGGTFCLLDMREPAQDGNYPVVCASAGDLGWEPDQYWFVADCFVSACRGSLNVDDMRESETKTEFDAAEPVAIYLERSVKSLKTLVVIKEHLGFEGPIAELKKLTQSIPCCVARTSYWDAIRRCAKVNAVEECLGIRLARDPTVHLPLIWGGNRRAGR
jgi:hypothetical protein